MHMKQLKPLLMFFSCLHFYWHPLFDFRSSIMIGTALSHSDMRKVNSKLQHTVACLQCCYRVAIVLPAKVVDHMSSLEQPWVRD